MGAAQANGVDCSVLVPVLNEENHVEQSLAAMRSQRFGGRLEFVIVDDGSSDGTPALLADLASRDDRIRLLKNSRQGTPSALNLALAHARGRWVCRMDAHTLYPQDYIALGVDRLRRGDTRWVSGPQVPRGRGRVSRAVELALRTRLGRGASRRWASNGRQPADEYELDSGVFAGVWARDTLIAYGGWDERWLRNQDSELAGRFHERGERLVCIPAMASAYAPRDSVKGLWRQYLQYGEFRARTARAHPQTMRRSHLLPPAVVVCIGTSVAGPSGFRTIARTGLAAYAGVLLAAGATAVVEASDPVDALLVPIVLATMHVAHGVGAFRGAKRYGAPLAAIAAAMGSPRLARRLWPGPQAVYAPSLEQGLAQRPDAA